MREEGYYFIKFKGEYHIAFWYDLRMYWTSPSLSMYTDAHFKNHYKDEEFEFISQSRIKMPNEI